MDPVSTTVQLGMNVEWITTREEQLTKSTSSQAAKFSLKQTRLDKLHKVRHKRPTQSVPLFCMFSPPKKRERELET